MKRYKIHIEKVFYQSKVWKHNYEYILWHNYHRMGTYLHHVFCINILLDLPLKQNDLFETLQSQNSSVINHLYLNKTSEKM